MSIRSGLVFFSLKYFNLLDRACSNEPVSFPARLFGILNILYLLLLGPSFVKTIHDATALF